MSSQEEPNDIKPDVHPAEPKQSAATGGAPSEGVGKKRKIKPEPLETEELETAGPHQLANSPSKKKKPNRPPGSTTKPNPATAASSSSTKSRQSAPPITPLNISPPLSGPRDPRLTVTWVEKAIDEASAEGRREVAVSFGVNPTAFSQAWGDTMKFRLKRIIRQGLLSGSTADQ